MQFLLLLFEAVLEHLASEEAAEDLLDLDGGLHLLLVLLLDADPELPVVIDEVLLVDADGQFARALLHGPLALGLLVGKDDLAVEAVFVRDDLVGLALVQPRLGPALRALLGGLQLFLRAVLLDGRGCEDGGRLPAFEGVVAEELAHGDVAVVVGEGELGGGECALPLGLALRFLHLQFFRYEHSNQLLYDSKIQHHYKAEAGKTNLVKGKIEEWVVLVWCWGLDIGMILLMSEWIDNIDWM